jgi:hypothetical protein
MNPVYSRRRTSPKAQGHPAGPHCTITQGIIGLRRAQFPEEQAARINSAAGGGSKRDGTLGQVILGLMLRLDVDHDL